VVRRITRRWFGLQRPGAMSASLAARWHFLVLIPEVNFNGFLQITNRNAASSKLVNPSISKSPICAKCLSRPSGLADLLRLQFVVELSCKISSCVETVDRSRSSVSSWCKPICAWLPPKIEESVYLASNKSTSAVISIPSSCGCRLARLSFRRCRAAITFTKNLIDSRPTVQMPLGGWLSTDGTPVAIRCDCFCVSTSSRS
jgi:hypothetical protein